MGLPCGNLLNSTSIYTMLFIACISFK